jgi:hypothetical protein
MRTARASLQVTVTGESLSPPTERQHLLVNSVKDGLKSFVASVIP